MLESVPAVAFKFFSDDLKAVRSPLVPDDTPALLLGPLGKNALDERHQRAAASPEFDALSQFLPDRPGASGGSDRAIAPETHYAPRPSTTLGVRGLSPASRADSMALDDLRKLFRETELALERSKSDANALSLEVNTLRDTGAQLAQEYARLGDACRQTERRSEVATEALSAIEHRLGPLEAVRDLTNSTDDKLASLSQLTKEVTHIAADFQAQKQSIDHGLVEATRMTELLAAFEARVTRLCGHELLGTASETVAQLERRVAEATVDLDERVNHFEGQKQTIQQALLDATRATDVLSNLDSRVATLTGPGQVLDHAVETVGHLERRAAEVTAHLERVATAKGELEHELVSLQKQLQTLTESARNTAELSAGDRQRPRILLASPVARLRAGVAAATTSRPTQKTTQPVQRWAAGFLALAALALFTVVIRSRDQPVETASAARATQPDAPVFRSASALPSRTLSLATLAMPGDRSGERLPLMPAGASASGAPSAKNPDPRAIVGVPSSRPGSVTSTSAPPTTAPAPNAPVVKDAGQEFIGALGVESVPAGADVFVNQQRVGETPIQLEGLRAGSHVVWIERQGYERWSMSVLVPADKQSHVNATLQPLRDR